MPLPARIGPRVAVALGVAGLATAGFGASVLSADAATRTFLVTVADGRALSITVEVPEGLRIDQIVFPGIDPADVREVAEVPRLPGAAPPAGTVTPVPAPAATTTATTPAPPAPATTTATTPATPPTPAPRETEPEAEPDPGTGAQGRAQKTTGDEDHGEDDHEEGGGEHDHRRPGASRAEPSRSRPGAEHGLPTFDDPAVSIAAPPSTVGVPNFFIERFRVPPFLLSIYQAAGMEYGIKWEILAAINEIETDYGRNLNVSSAGALGWMQFMPATWRAYGVDANGDGERDPYNPVDAIFAAARYLKASGGQGDLRRAIFAYNHADWYVDSVLMRARLIGGLPSDLVGSLTGLTLGIFPVAGRARYADDAGRQEESRRRALSSGSATGTSRWRKGTRLYARPGTQVVAVQDGRITKLGRTAELGRFVQLADDYGNTYTYAHLGRVARRYPVAAESPAARSLPASRKERLFANPLRDTPWRHGGARQLYGAADVPTDDALRLLGVGRDRVTMKRMRVGASVAGGTPLGEIRRVSGSRAPNVRFEIRPAGRRSPLIDPKPILDGWKLLEATARTRAAGRDPMFDRDLAVPRFGQAMLMNERQLERRVLGDGRIEIYPCGRRDVEAGRIDRRVLATLLYLADSGLRPTVTSLTCGHGYLTASGNVSHHSSGNAVDIARINGVPILGHQGPGSITDTAIRRLLTLQGTLEPTQIVSLMQFRNEPSTLALGDHADHIHVGFRPQPGTTVRMAPGIRTLLRADQWPKVVARLGRIDNPRVPRRVSRASLRLKRR